MKYKATYLILFFALFSSFAQNKVPQITIKEKKIGKRVELYASNMTNKSYNATLNVHTQDFKRANTAPIVKTVPPHSAIRMTAMTQLADTPGIYSYDLMIGEIGYEIALKNNKTYNKKINAALKHKSITLYTKPNCELCNDTKRFLKRNRVIFKERSVVKDSSSLKKIVTDFDVYTSDLPIMKIQDSVYSKIKNERDLVLSLNNHM